MMSQPWHKKQKMEPNLKKKTIYLVFFFFLFVSISLYLKKNTKSVFIFPKNITMIMKTGEQETGERVLLDIHSVLFQNLKSHCRNFAPRGNYWVLSRKLSVRGSSLAYSTKVDSNTPSYT